MSRWKQLTKSKREFLQVLIEIDDVENFLNGYEFQIIVDALREGRYRNTETERFNRIAQEHKDKYRFYKKNNV